MWAVLTGEGKEPKMGTEGSGGAGDSGGTPNGQQGGTPNPPANTNNNPPAGGTPQNNQQPVEDWNAVPEWARSKYRTLSGDLDELRKKQGQYERTQQTELQTVSGERDTLRSENATLKEQVRDFTLSGLFAAEATKAGAIDPSLLYAVAKAGLKEGKGSDGRPVIENIADVLKTLKTSHPNQFRNVSRAGNRDAGAGNGTATDNGGSQTAGVSINQWMRDQVRPTG